MVRFSILAPDATVNYIKNPSLRYDTTDWNAQGATLTRVLTRARFGVASLQVVTAGSAVREGAFFRVSALSGVSEPVTVSAYVRGTGKVRIRLDNNVIGGAEFASQPVELTDEFWQRIWVTGFATGGNDLRLYVETDEGTAKARTFYVDGAQLERKGYPTTYCDGDQPGCRWDGLYHASTSQRAADTRAGGRWVQLAGEAREAEDLYMTVAGGLGMAPLVNNVQSFAISAGGFLDRTKVNSRVMTLTFHAKHHVDDRDDPVSLEHLHVLRQTLIDLVKPDRTGGNEPFWFEYEDGGQPVYLQAHYDGGLEGEWDVRNQFFNSFGMRLLAMEPFFMEDSREAAAVDFQESVFFNYVIGRVNGVWNRLNYGVNGQVAKMAIGPRGQIYALGTFTVVNNNAAATNPLLSGQVAYWDGEKWVVIASTTAGGLGGLDTIAVLPNGNVVVGGNFTSINGTAANYIAVWDGSAWAALGTGMNNQVDSLAIGPAGDIYAGGQFTTAGGVSCARIARWDGTKWNRLGQYGGLNNRVDAWAITQDGTRLYVGGLFTDENGNPGSGLNAIAQYDTVTGLFSAMGSGFSGGISSDRVFALLITESGVIAGGDFTLSGSMEMNHVGIWNGGAWQAMGTGFDREVQHLCRFSNGDVLAAGEFNQSGTLPMSKLSLWNGSTWNLLDVFFPVTSTDSIWACAIDPSNDNVFLGFGSNIGTNVQAFVSGVTTLTNPGSAECYPSFFLVGPGRLRWLENETTRTRLYFNLEAQSGEEIMIDPGAGTITSSVRGNLLYTLAPGSDFRELRLLPGANTLRTLMLNDSGATLHAQWPVQHWSADGSV